jgi:hypothetical protein
MRRDEASQFGLLGRDLRRLEEDLIGRAMVLLRHLVEEQSTANRINSRGRPAAENETRSPPAPPSS